VCVCVCVCNVCARVCLCVRVEMGQNVMQKHDAM